MMRNRTLFVFLISLLLGLASASVASAGKSTTTRYWLDTATVRGAATDALLHDGVSTYPESQVLSYLADEKTTDVHGFQDLFYFHVEAKGGRAISVRDPQITSGTPLRCRIGKVIVKSSTVPDFSQIQPGTTVTADGVLQCYINTRYEGYIIGYPNGADECLEITRVTTKTWSFAAPPTCDSAVWWQPAGRNDYTTLRPFNSSAVPTPAEFELTATLK